jgi:hypothetical protein
MSRFQNEVEQIRKELRAEGYPSQAARKLAPRLAAMRQESRDQEEKPFSWLGGPAYTDDSDW